MNEKKQTLKSFAKEAKKRMCSGYWAEIKVQKQTALDAASEIGKASEEVTSVFTNKLKKQIYCNSSNLKEEEKLYKSVCDILENAGNEVVNPLAILLDKKHLSTLDDPARQRYVSKFACKIRELVQRYEREKELKIV